MKKNEYMTPEMEVVEFQVKSALLQASSGTEETPGTGDSDEL